VLALAVVAGVFVVVIPKFASYAAVWHTISGLTPAQLGLLLGVTAFNIVTYWPQMMAAMPGLTLAQAAVNNQSSTAIANVLPGGGAVAVGLAYAEFRSWGFSGGDIALLTLVTGVWNTFIKLGMPVVALAILAIQGNVGHGLVIGSLVGLAALAICVALLALVLWRESFARSIGDRLGRMASFFLRLARRPPVKGWSQAAVRFRGQTIDLIARRWIALTVTTIISHLGLYLVLVIAVRDVGISARSVTWAEVLGVFAFARLVSALPITPGGLGVVEVSYIGGLVLAGGPKPQVVAAVLIFRALTYLLQIPLGPVAYVVWRRKRSWRVDGGGRGGARKRNTAPGGSKGSRGASSAKRLAGAARRSEA
jgi:uncharacterized protein (TIRG00374 family)